ncbi:MAG: hypothetical protein M1836_006397 [Candelina mexicana]|nr:MAG: hypothetical protein M1836_006397 [Candelina mexicana]
MDASDDSDVKLQRASADLLADFQRCLPKFLWHEPKSIGSSGRSLVRRRVGCKDVDSLVRLIKLLMSEAYLTSFSPRKLEPFQEWPQLLDPHLASFIPQIVNAFLEILQLPRYKPSRGSGSDATRRPSTVPMPRAICQLLYTLCKIRGEKVISQFLSNEPKYLEPLLSAFEVWDAPHDAQQVATGEQDGPMTWYERYIVLLWLSHLLLAPFDLASISSIGLSEDTEGGNPEVELHPNLPGIARRLLPICYKHIVSASKERESTRTLLVRLSLRPDMRQLGLLQSLMHWASSSLECQSTDGPSMSIYQHVGLLSFIAGLLASADMNTIGPFLFPIFKLSQRILAGSNSIHENINSSALARKILIKIRRSITVLVLQPVQSKNVPEEQISHILEDVIDHLLTALADKDTPVRYAASKALSVIASALESEMAAEVVEAVLMSMKQDLSWEDEAGGVSADNVDVILVKRVSSKPRFAAVNPLRWHGLTLTLAHLLFRRSAAPEQLPELLNALILALEFEQRSSTSSSIGTNVRDSACFGIWSLARRYTTAELSEVDSSRVYAANSIGKSVSVLQVLATELVVAGTLDPSGNIRRGSSAALQELIGRHPDTIIKGISLVQAVDYHAVALRSRAITEVAINASKLGSHYWEAMLDGLLGWRGVGSPDAESRRLASKSIGLLSFVPSVPRIDRMIAGILEPLSKHPTHAVDERHGRLLALAEITGCVRKAALTAVCHDSNTVLAIRSIWEVFSDVSLISAKDFVSTSQRPELMAEAACRLISALAQWTYQKNCHTCSETNLDVCISVLSLCLNREEKLVIRTTASAASDLFTILTRRKRVELTRSWIKSLDEDWKERPRGAYRGFGHVAALGAVFAHFSDEKDIDGVTAEQGLIIDSLVARTVPKLPVELRVAAIQSLATGVLVITASMVISICTSLEDYTVDQRGDIGSWIRLAAIDAVTASSKHGAADWSSGQNEMFAGVCRLAAEKLDKVRIRAWACLQEAQGREHVATAGFDSVGQVSSHRYFLELLQLLRQESVRIPLLQGYVTSAGAGSEAILIASRGALVDFAEQCDEIYNLCDLSTDLVEVVKRNSNNDRVAVPAMEVLSFFLFDTGYAARLGGFKWRTLFTTVQKAHFKSGNVQKLEAAVKIYAGLLVVEEVRKNAAEKLLSMLLHRYSQVRNAVADALWVACGENRLKAIDWGLSPGELKQNRWEEFRQQILHVFEER